MLVAAVMLGVGAVCVYYGARSLRVIGAVRRLRDRTHGEPGHPTDRAESADEGRAGSGDQPPDLGSVERGLVLLALGGLCFLFGVLAV